MNVQIIYSIGRGPNIDNVIVDMDKWNPSNSEEQKVHDNVVNTLNKTGNSLDSEAWFTDLSETGIYSLEKSSDPAVDLNFPVSVDEVVYCFVDA